MIADQGLNELARANIIKFFRSNSRNIHMFDVRPARPFTGNSRSRIISFVSLVDMVNAGLRKGE